MHCSHHIFNCTRDITVTWWKMLFVSVIIAKIFQWIQQCKRVGEHLPMVPHIWRESVLYRTPFYTVLLYIFIQSGPGCGNCWGGSHFGSRYLQPISKVRPVIGWQVCLSGINQVVALHIFWLFCPFSQIRYSFHCFFRSKQEIWNHRQPKKVCR